MDYELMMRKALTVATKSGNDVPVGALILDASGEVVATACNNREISHDATGHSEIIAIRQANQTVNDWRLENCTLVVTLEPCVMCAGAIIAARIGRVVFGAWDEKVGAAGSAYDLLRDPRLGKPIEVVGGVIEAECSQLLKEFFNLKRIAER